jgi:hypothetical protein
MNKLVLYDEGMTSTASNMLGLLEEAAGEASITVDQVKVWFLNFIVFYVKMHLIDHL